MSEPQQWAFIESLQPKADETQFDLARAFDAVVLVRAEVPPDGHTAATLGTERGGYGVVIREDGLVLTIGYLINEASQIWLTTNRGTVVEGYRLAYDQATGFGLIQPLGKLDAPHLPRGSAADVKVGDSAFVIGHGGARPRAQDPDHREARVCRATGNTCSTRRSLPHRHIRNGAAPRCSMRRAT